MLKVLSKGRNDEKGTILQRRGLDGSNTRGNYKKYQDTNKNYSVYRVTSL